MCWRLGHQPTALLGCGRIFRRWGLMEVRCALDRDVPKPSHSLCHCLPGHSEVSCFLHYTFPLWCASGHRFRASGQLKIKIILSWLSWVLVTTTETRLIYYPAQEYSLWGRDGLKQFESWKVPSVSKLQESDSIGNKQSMVTSAASYNCSIFCRLYHLSYELSLKQT